MSKKMVNSWYNKRFSTNRTVASEPMPVADWQRAEAILATLVARAYAADHPELFAHSRNLSEGGGDRMSEAA